jgi:UDP-glucose:(heptosyl)LPS alpha-1,3-glucosyltransferase
MANPVDLVVGFNKMPGLDVYYAADSCFKAKVYEERGFISRLLPRSKHFIAFEEAVFGAQSHTRSLMISKPEIDSYQRYYQTPSDRLTLLPPGIRRDRCAPNDLAQQRQTLRQQMAIGEHEHILLMVGSGFKTKGLDRAIEGLAALPAALKNTTRLWVVGDDKAAAYQALAKRLGVAERVEFLGARDNVPDYLWAADLLVHPAYRENTGTILLEAAVAGLPVLTTAACGYASYIRDFALGVVVEAPFEQSVYNQQLAQMLVSEQRQQWQQNGIAFGRRENIFSMPAVAADCIEKWGA